MNRLDIRLVLTFTWPCAEPAVPRQIQDATPPIVLKPGGEHRPQCLATSCAGTLFAPRLPRTLSASVDRPVELTTRAVPACLNRHGSPLCSCTASGHLSSVIDYSSFIIGQVIESSSHRVIDVIGHRALGISRRVFVQLLNRSSVIGHRSSVVGHWVIGLLVNRSIAHHSVPCDGSTWNNLDA